jgi:site-specific recombinase XerD
VHQLRHTFATRVYETTGDLLITQQLLGHASPATTAIYAQVSGSRLRDAVTITFDRQDLAA